MVPVTASVTVHVAPAAILAPANATLAAPAAAVTVPDVHVVAALGCAATVTLVGNASLSATEESAIVFGLASVMVSADVAPGAMSSGEKLLLTITVAALPIVRTADAGAPFVEPCAVAIAPAGIVLVYEPVIVPVTDSVIVQVAPAARLAPPSVTLDPPGAAVTVPLGHVVAAFGVAAIVTFAGSASVSASDVSATALAALLLTEIVNVDVAPGAIVAGAKLFATVTPVVPMLSVACAGATFVTAWVVVTAPAGIVLT
jgi:hypothetical protein